MGHMSHQTQETLNKRACPPFAENRTSSSHRRRREFILLTFYDVR